MTNSFISLRKLIVIAIVLPLALMAGYLTASPTDQDSVAIIGLVFVILAIPLLLRWHHPLLILCWNACLTVFFLPGSPYLWMIVGGVSLGLTLLHKILDKEFKPLNVPSVTWSLIALAVVVLVTAKMSGGLGVRSLGGGVYGGKKYYYIWFAIIAYFALSSQRIPLAKAGLYSGMFLLSGVTALMSNLVYIVGPAAWFLYAVFPIDWAVAQAMDDFGSGPLGTRFSRIGGLAMAGMAAYQFLLMRYGVRGILDWSKPWRFILLLLVVCLSLLGGFRSAVVLFAVLFIIQFWNEGLLRSRMAPLLLAAGVLAFVALIPLVQTLPLSMQRSLSVLPLPVDPAARADAKGSTEWRIKMWQALAPEIPRHFWLGKGYTASATDYYLAQESVRRGLSSDYEMTILSGDYHNGPLSILIPFGVWGVLAFLAFIIAALRVLYLNRRHGNPALERINTFLLSYFVAKLVFFVTVFGALHIDIATFVGLVGLSISINGGALRDKRPSTKPLQAPVDELSPLRTNPVPAFQRLRGI